MKIKNFNNDEELNILRDNMGASLVPAIKTGHTIKYFSNDEILKLGRKYPEKKIKRTKPPGEPIKDQFFNLILNLIIINITEILIAQKYFNLKIHIQFLKKTIFHCKIRCNQTFRK